MLVIGVLIAIAGFVESLTFQRVFSAVMLVIQSTYLYLDVKTSDTPFGNALYKGPNSVAPVVIGLVFTLVFLVLTISALRYRATSDEQAMSN
jgi:heme/copper-type cytochrome/quinol oxidase subunit 2